MTNIRVFAQHLYSQNIQANLALLTLANFFHHYPDPTAELNGDVIMEFYFRALEFPYWQKNRKELSKEVRAQLESFLRHRKAGINLEKLVHAEELQVIEIESPREFQIVAENHFKSVEKTGECRKVIPLEQQSLMVHILEGGAVKIRQLLHLACLHRGQLKPFPGLVLHYNRRLELEPNHPQSLRLDAFSAAHFQQTSNRFKTEVLKGYNFRRHEQLETETLQKNPKLFYALKRLEKHFIDIHSDPFYKSLIHRLESSARQIQLNPHQDLEPALDAYEQGRLAVQEVFPDDKQLELLVKDLGHHLILAWQSNKSGKKDKAEEPWPKKIHPNKAPTAQEP